MLNYRIKFLFCFFNPAWFIYHRNHIKFAQSRILMGSPENSVSSFLCFFQRYRTCRLTDIHRKTRKQVIVMNEWPILCKHPLIQAHILCRIFFFYKMLNRRFYVAESNLFEQIKNGSINHPFPIQFCPTVFLIFAKNISQNHFFCGFVHFYQLKRTNQIIPPFNRKCFKYFKNQSFVQHHFFLKKKIRRLHFRKVFRQKPEHDSFR